MNPGAKSGADARRLPVQGIVFLLVTILGWGLTWPINKVILESMSPFWMTAIRSCIAGAALLAITLPFGRLVLPSRADVPVLLSIALLHMVGFSLLAAIGLQLVPVGRSVVLAYTTPLWVIPGAAIFLRERFSARRAAGMVLGMLGLGVMFNPFAFDWSDRNALIGHAALLAAALLWAGAILHIRGHRWRATPFQLVPWETLLAAAILLPVAFAFEPHPVIDWNVKLVILLLTTSILGNTIPYWAVAMAGRSLSAGTVSLGLLATPILGVLAAGFALGEAPGLSVWAALALVIGGAGVAARSPRAVGGER